MSISQRAVLDPDRDVLLVPPTYRSAVATAISMAVVLTLGSVALIVIALQPFVTSSVATWVGAGSAAVAGVSWVARAGVVLRARNERAILTLSAVGRFCAVIAAGAYLTVGIELGLTAGLGNIIVGALVLYFNGRALFRRLDALRARARARA